MSGKYGEVLLVNGGQIHEQHLPAYLKTTGSDLASETTRATTAEAAAIQRANHTGTQSADTLTDGTTNKAFLATERTKLTGVATAATANSSDATLLSRANHTGTQAATTITGLATVATTGTYASLTGVPNFELSTYYGGSWGAAINSAIAAANTAGGGVIRFPENTTITMGGTATALGSHITLLIPRSCTIVKSSGTFSHLFGLATPTYPAYTEDVHIIGGTWQWTTTTDPGADDGRGPILFIYGNNVSVENAEFQCLNTAYSTRRTSGPFFRWCNRVKVLNCKITDSVAGVTASSQAAPDNAGRTCSDVVVRDNEIVRTGTPTGTTTPGVFVKGDYTNSRTVSNVKVRDNLITNHGMGIEVGPGDGARVTDNVISGYQLGISMADMTTSRVLRNDLSGSVTGRLIGIEVTGSANSRVVDNKIIDTSQTTAPGIGIYGSSTTRHSNKTDVVNNYVEGGAAGVQLTDNASYCRAQGNTLRGGTIGVQVGPATSTTTANTVYNIIDGNLIDRPTSYGVNITTYTTFSTTNLMIANNMLIGASATINGSVSGVSSQNVTGT